MAKPTKKNQPQGHPAKKDPVIAKISKLQTELVYLTRDVQRRLTPEQISHWNAAVFGIMDTYAIISGMPRPDSTVDLNFDEFMADKAARMALFEAWEEEQRKIPVEVTSVKKTNDGLEVTGVIPESARFIMATKTPMSIQPNSVIPKPAPKATFDNAGPTAIKNCQRCNHMSFNHAWLGDGYGACSFTNCACNHLI